MNNCTCWYTYYDVDSTNANDCQKENEDVILTPDQVPLDEMDYSMFNAPTKVIIRQLLVGEAAESLAFVRGTYSGAIQMISNSLTMDYNMFLNFGQREKENAMKSLDERLQRMNPYEVMKKQAELVDSMIQAKKGTPLPIMVI